MTDVAWTADSPDSGALSDRPFLYRANTSDEGVIAQIFQNNDYDLGRLRRSAELMAYHQARAARGERPLIVDAGANIGAASIYFHRVFPDAAIVAIEPDRANFEILSMNAAGRPITCLHGAVASRASPVKVVDPGEGNWGFRTEAVENGDVGGETVAGIPIGRIFDACAINVYPFIVKIDIEGAEDELFSADTAWLARTPLVIIELHDWLMPKRGTSLNFLRAIAGLDRDFVHIGENIFSIDNRL